MNKFGKFDSAEKLIAAYDSLQKEFTRKSQILSKLQNEKDSQPAEIEVQRNSKNLELDEDSQQKGKISSLDCKELQQKGEKSSLDCKYLAQKGEKDFADNQIDRESANAFSKEVEENVNSSEKSIGESKMDIKSVENTLNTADDRFSNLSEREDQENWLNFDGLSACEIDQPRQNLGTSPNSPPRMTFGELVSKYPNAACLKAEIADCLLSNPTLVTDNNCLERAYLQVASAKFVPATVLAQDESFLEQNVYNNPKIADKILRMYIEKIACLPTTITRSANSPLVPPSKPKSFEEAGKMAKHFFG